MYSSALTRGIELTICVDDPPSIIEATIVDAALKGGISLHKKLKILNILTEKKMRNFVKKDTFI